MVVGFRVGHSLSYSSYPCTLMGNRDWKPWDPGDFQHGRGDQGSVQCIPSHPATQESAGERIHASFCLGDSISGSAQKQQICVIMTTTTTTIIIITIIINSCCCYYYHCHYYDPSSSPSSSSSSSSILI